jgi:hypothetical protein
VVTYPGADHARRCLTCVIRRDTLLHHQKASALARQYKLPLHSPPHYDYIDSNERFYKTELPSKKTFYNRLKTKHIFDADYAHVQVWNPVRIRVRIYHPHPLERGRSIVYSYSESGFKLSTSSLASSEMLLKFRCASTNRILLAHMESR